MTVIAWDGVTLAADRRMHNGHDEITCNRNKLIRIDKDHIGAFTGTQPVGRMMVEWLRAGGKREDFPAECREEKWTTALMVVSRDGEVVMYQDFPEPSHYGAGPMALVCADLIARVAMYCGKTAEEAVDVCTHFDSRIGGGIDTMSFE